MEDKRKIAVNSGHTGYKAAIIVGEVAWMGMSETLIWLEPGERHGKSGLNKLSYIFIFLMYNFSVEN